MKNTDIVSIFEYADFRLYLKDYQEAKYIVDKKYSKNGLCRMLGLPRTKSYFKDVLAGKIVTQTFVERFIITLELSPEEAAYFRVLVKFNQAQEADEREFYFEKLISLNRTPKKFLEPEAFDYYKNWHNSAIRALLDIYEFKGNYKELHGKIYPPIPEKAVRESIAFLKKTKLIKKTQNGSFKPTDKSIAIKPGMQDVLIKQYQLKCLELTKHAILASPSPPQNLSTNTLSVSPKGYQRIAAKISKFKSEIRSLVHKDTDPADRVYQLNINFFPQSK